MKKNKSLEIISGLLVLLFAYAAVSKLFHYNDFKLQLGKSPYVNDFAGMVAWALPLGELAVVIALVINRTRLIGLYASLFLMTMFTAYIYAMLHFSYYIPCSCGGVLSQMSWGQHFIFNICFVALSIVGIFLELRLTDKTEHKIQLSRPAIT
jgi:hypothetical protein